MIINKKTGIVIITLGLFLTTGVLVLLNATTAFDDSIQSFVFSMHRDFLTGFFKIVTYSANWQTVVIFCAVFLTIKRTRIRIGVPISFASAISTMLYKCAKLFYARPRPEIGFHMIEQGGLSFPSGHSMTGLVFYGLLIYFTAKYGEKNRAQKALMSLLVVLIVLIGFSRVYLGVHYPCLLYTSDAADEEDSVDLGGR